jgi:hypothetical protein
MVQASNFRTRRATPLEPIDRPEWANDGPPDKYLRSTATGRLYAKAGSNQSDMMAVTVPVAVCSLLASPVMRTVHVPIVVRGPKLSRVFSHVRFADSATNVSFAAAALEKARPLLRVCLIS